MRVWPGESLLITMELLSSHEGISDVTCSAGANLRAEGKRRRELPVGQLSTVLVSRLWGPWECEGCAPMGLSVEPKDRSGFCSSEVWKSVGHSSRCPVNSSPVSEALKPA